MHACCDEGSSNNSALLAANRNSPTQSLSSRVKECNLGNLWSIVLSCHISDQNKAVSPSPIVTLQREIYLSTNFIKSFHQKEPHNLKA
jgi:hypothetical protein